MVYGLVRGYYEHSHSLLRCHRNPTFQKTMCENLPDFENQVSEGDWCAYKRGYMGFFLTSYFKLSLGDTVFKSDFYGNRDKAILAPRRPTAFWKTAHNQSSYPYLPHQ